MQEYEGRVAAGTRSYASFMTMSQIAALVFDVLVKAKHAHVDDQLRGRYGFTTADFIRGHYKRTEKRLK